MKIFLDSQTPTFIRMLEVSTLGPLTLPYAQCPSHTQGKIHHLSYFMFFLQYKVDGLKHSHKAMAQIFLW